MLRYLLLSLFCGYSFAQTGTNMKDLYTYLFSTLNYNKDIRPAIVHTVPTQVSVDLTLNGLHFIDEAKQQMVSVGTLTIKWKDDFLTWNSSLYGGANFIDVPQGKVWKPNIQLRNGFNDFVELGGSFMFLRIFHTGDVVWSPNKVFDTKCKIDVAFFPFDQQTCSVELMSWNSDLSTVNITNGVNGLRIDDELNHGHWSVSSHYFRTFRDDTDSVISFSITLDRKPKIYVLNIIIPFALLAILNLATFILPNSCGEKLSYSITVLLALSIFLTIVASMLPANSDSTSYLEVYIVTVVAKGVFILIVTAISLRIHERADDREIPGWIQNLTRRSWKLHCQCKKNINSNAKNYNGKTKVENIDKKLEDKGSSSKEVKPVRWKDVTSALDFYLLWICLFVMIILTFIFLGLFSSK
ncbi:neuronal acetylcholine receptor subunit alpha-3-like [Saccostrea echinata]|uniref:neuronal acetylcholine receptor subunit alpha-3-like n=1 Tax=Saccostrea echinata TaxID=191078 RepID=UPI002A7F03BC|nr:neuronal acetylcholine receptor subunit alpha-3-like [Saccostrea echinata]